jgi:two-component system chemotaxis response regulator CheY
MAYNILIVDDSATTRAMIRRTIQLAQVPVENLFEASNGKDALELLDCVRVDLVLADLNMPEMGGVEMTQQMRQMELTKNTPVIVVSAEPSTQRLEQLKHDGVQGYIRKPFTPETVRNAITGTLGDNHV